MVPHCGLDFLSICANIYSHPFFLLKSRRFCRVSQRLRPPPIWCLLTFVQVYVIFVLSCPPASSVSPAPSFNCRAQGQPSKANIISSLALNFHSHCLQFVGSFSKKLVNLVCIILIHDLSVRYGVCVVNKMQTTDLVSKRSRLTSPHNRDIFASKYVQHDSWHPRYNKNQSP